MNTPPSPLGEQLDQAYVAAVSDWLHYNRRGMDTEVALTSTLKRIQLEITLRPGRHGLAIVTLVGRRQVDTDTYASGVEATPLSALRAAGI
jgi:hypothetical protein